MARQRKAYRLFGIGLMLFGFVLLTAYECELAVSGNIFNKINDARSEANLRELTFDAELGAYALERANKQAEQGFLSHDGSVRPGDRWQQGWFGEVLLTHTYPEAQAVQAAFDLWMESPEHRDILMFSEYTHIGVACVRDNNLRYWCAGIFGELLS